MPKKQRKRSTLSEIAKANTQDLSRFTKELEKDGPEWAKAIIPLIESLIPLLGFLMACADIAEPYIVEYGMKAYAIMTKHEEIFYGALGFILCFFGGVYPALILTVETYYQCGWEKSKQAIAGLYGEYKKIKAKFDEVKEDRKGLIAAATRKLKGEDDCDVNNLKLSLKLDLFFEVCDPKVIQDSLSVLWAHWLCTVAVLNVYFAKVIALGNGIGESVQKFLTQFVVPLLKVALPEKYHRWIPVLLGYVSRAIGISIAWTAQAFISAAHSGFRGGVMMARMFFQYQAKRKGESYDERDSNVDEIMGLVLAGAGFFLQVTFAFGVPFPFYFVTWPFALMEYWIRWTLADSTMFA